MQVKSGSAEMTREGDAKLTGGVAISQGDREVTAESATYDASERRFEVEGNVEYRSPDVRLKGGTGSWNALGTGKFTGAEFELPQRPARGSASELEMTDQGEIKMRDVRFTTCPAGNTDWELRASSIDIDQRTQQGKGRNVRVDLKGIPILYTPVITFPVGNLRKSGFLFPSFGNSDKSGFEIGVPYYYNLAPNYDLTLTPFLLSRRGFGVGVDYRYLTERSRGKLDNNYLPGDDLAGDDRRLSTLWHRTDFTDRLRLEADLVRRERHQLLRGFRARPGRHEHHVPRPQHPPRLARRALAARRRSAGLPDHRPRGGPARPAVLAPAAARLHGALAHGGRIRSLASTPRPCGSSAMRASPAFAPTRRRRSPGRCAAPAITSSRAPPFASRPTNSRTRRPARTIRRTARRRSSRSTRASCSSARPATHGQFVHTLEPRLRYNWIPFRDQDDLPLFDTALPDLNLVQLFRTNRYVGADRLGDANELAAGLTTRLLRAESGQQYLTATVGQRFYFDSPRVVLPGEVPEQRSASNMVGEVELTAWRNWSSRVAMEWDYEESNTLRGEASVQYKPGPDTVVNLGYRYRENLLEQWDAGFAWRISENWQLYARQVYSTREDKSLDRFAGFEYGGCCWSVRLLARNYVSNRTGESDNSVLLQVELKGLSSVGTQNDTFLERGIRGYSPASASTDP